MILSYVLTQVSTGNPRVGKPCGFAFSTGTLSDCRKLYFDEAEDMGPRYRIIYRLLPNEDEPAKAEVIRIGLKVPYGDEDEIYRQVGRALDRLPGPSRGGLASVARLLSRLQSCGEDPARVWSRWQWPAWWRSRG